MASARKSKSRGKSRKKSRGKVAARKATAKKKTAKKKSTSRKQASRKKSSPAAGAKKSAKKAAKKARAQRLPAGRLPARRASPRTTRGGPSSIEPGAARKLAVVAECVEALMNRERPGWRRSGKMGADYHYDMPGMTAFLDAVRDRLPAGYDLNLSDHDFISGCLASTVAELEIRIAGKTTEISGEGVFLNRLRTPLAPTTPLPRPARPRKKPAPRRPPRPPLRLGCRRRSRDRPTASAD
jgi:hypothetical protein